MHGMGECRVLWARRYVVAFMALVGISTALLVNMLGQARIFTMASREHLIPLVWARVSQRYGTPIAAQITMGVASGPSLRLPACQRSELANTRTESLPLMLCHVCCGSLPCPIWWVE